MNPTGGGEENRVGNVGAAQLNGSHRHFMSPNIYADAPLAVPDEDFGSPPPSQGRVNLTSDVNASQQVGHETEDFGQPPSSNADLDSISCGETSLRPRAHNFFDLSAATRRLSSAPEPSSRNTSSHFAPLSRSDADGDFPMLDGEIEYIGILRGVDWYPSVEGTPLPSASAPRCTADEFLDLCTPSPPLVPATLPPFPQQPEQSRGEALVDPQENSAVRHSLSQVVDLTSDSIPQPPSVHQSHTRPRRATRLEVDYRVPTEEDLPQTEDVPRRIRLIPHSDGPDDWVDGENRHRVRPPTPPPVYYRRSDWAGADAPPIFPLSRVRPADWVRQASTPLSSLHPLTVAALRRIQPSGPLNRKVLEEEIRRIRLETEATDGAEAGYLWHCLEMFLRYSEQHHWP